MSQTIRKTSRLMTIDSVVHNVLNDLDTYDQKQVIRYKQWVIRGLKGIRLHVLTSIQIDTFTVGTNNIVNLPDDYIRHTKIGIIRNGRIYTLSEDKNIPITRTIVNGATATYADLKEAESIPNLSTWLAAPPKIWNIAFHRYDEEYNRLILSGDMMGESIVVEYVSTGVSEKGEILIPVQAEEALIAWVHKQRSLNDKASTISERKERNIEFRKCMVDLVNFRNSFTLDDLKDAINSGNTQLPGR